jgi:tetratricopeptide (TPR) repeat protein
VLGYGPPVMKTSPRWIPLCAAGLVAVTLLVLWPALRVPFFFDDTGDVVDNPEIRQLWPPLWLTAGPPESNALAGRPVSALSFALVYAVAGESAIAQHAVNLLLHAAAALVLFGLVRRTLLLPRAGPFPPEVATALGAVSALLWAIHPLNTEPVAYAVQRTEQLWALFYLLTLYAALRATGPGARAWTAVAIAACALGMGCKEIMVSAPLAVVAFDRVFREKGALRERRTLYGGLAACWLVLGALLLSGKQGAVALHANDPLTPWQYLFTQGRVIARYFRLVLWPRPLALVYDWPQATPVAEGLPPFLLIAALCVATAWGLWRKHPLGFVGACVFMALAPSSSVIPLPTEIAAERRMYLPSAALVAAIVVSAWRGLSRLARPHPVGLAAAAVVAVALALGARARLQDYRSELAIWEDTVRKSPYHSTALGNYGRELVRADRPAEAIPYLRRAIQMRSDVAVMHYLLGWSLLLTKDAQGAVAPLREALRLQPDTKNAHFALGQALAAMKDWDGAAAAFTEALRVDPKDEQSRTELAKVHNNRASAFVAQGRPEDALRALEESVRVRPEYALGHLNLGNARAGQGQWKGAIEAWITAARVAPDDARIRSMVVQRLQGLPPEARPLVAPALASASPSLRSAVEGR